MKKKLVFLCLTIVPLLGLYAGGGQGGGSAGTDPYANAPREVSMTVLDRGAVPASEGSYENNRWVRWINENSPVKVTFVPVQRSDATNKINALFAAGTAPDIVWEYNKPFMDGLYNQGVIQPVGDYVEQYSTAYKQYLKDNPDLVPYLMEDDGKMYGISSKRNILTTVNGSLWVRNDWLKKFNMAVPKTLAEALTFMRRVRDEDPDGNGVKDTWGMGSDYTWKGYMEYMFGRPSESFLVQNGHYVDWTSSPAYRDCLAFLAQIYQEGLIDPEYITDTNYTRQRQLMVTGKIGFLAQGIGNIAGMWREQKQNVPTAELIPIEPWETPHGRPSFASEVPILKMVVMNKTARNPKAIMEYLDWLITDGYWTLSWGQEGRHYRLVNGIPQVIDAELNKVEKDYLHSNYEFALIDNNKITLDWIPVQAAQDPISQEWAKLFQRGAELNLQYSLRYDVPYVPTSDTISAFSAATSAQVGAIETDIMTGKVSVDEGIRQINEYKRASGWDAVNAEQDVWYQKNKSLW